MRAAFHPLATPALDARLLIMAHMGITAEAMITAPETPITPAQYAHLMRACQARLGGQSVARLIGVRAFYGLDFKLSRGVLDPRPDSETLVDAALALYKNKRAHFADMGTGSGCLAIAILHNAPQCRALGIDISRRALRMARINAARAQVQTRFFARHNVWGRGLKKGLTAPFDFITANPPYIATQDLAQLAPEVRLCDPRRALDGGSDGLVHYRALLRDAPRLIRTGGHIFLEIGTPQQAQDVGVLLREAGFALVHTAPDLSGSPRVLVAQKQD